MFEKLNRRFLIVGVFLCCLSFSWSVVVAQEGDVISVPLAGHADVPAASPAMSSMTDEGQSGFAAFVESSMIEADESVGATATGGLETFTFSRLAICPSSGIGCNSATFIYSITSITPASEIVRFTSASGESSDCGVSSDSVAVCNIPPAGPGQEFVLTFVVEYTPEAIQFVLIRNVNGAISDTVYDLPGLPDVGGLAIDAFDNISGGATQVDFTIANIGTGNADAFNVDIVFSEDAVMDINDQVVGTVTITDLPDGEQANRSVLVALPIDLDTLRSQAVVAYPPGLSNVNVTQPMYYIGLSVDTANTLTEIDETNNVNNGLGFDIDAVGYFPWDYDGNGIVDGVDVSAVSSRIGVPVTGFDRLADINRDGNITPTDAIEVANRAGYQVEFDLNE